MNATQLIRDEELVAYYWHEGLESARRDDIAAQLEHSAALRQRYAALVRELDAMAGALQITTQPEPAPDFEARLWRRIETRLPAPVATLRPRVAVRSAPWRWAMAATVLLALGAGYLLGRQETPRAPALAQLSDDAAQRLL